QHLPWLTIRVPSQRRRERAEFLRTHPRWVEAAPVWRNIRRSDLARPHLLFLFASGDAAAIQAERLEHDRSDGSAAKRGFLGVLRDHYRSTHEPALCRETDTAQPDELADEDNPGQIDSAAHRSRLRAVPLYSAQQQRPPANGFQDRSPVPYE